MPDKTISRDQLKRLQTLWGKYASHEMVKNSRDERLRWANEHLYHMQGKLRGLMSFKELTQSEASDLINLLQGELGIAESRPAKNPRAGYSRHYRDRDAAHAAGTEGRRKSGRKQSTIATTEDLAMIEAQLSLMGWNRARLDAFLQSASSPIKNRSNPQLRTLGDVNKVLWALKRIAYAARKRSEATA